MSDKPKLRHEEPEEPTPARPPEPSPPEDEPDRSDYALPGEPSVPWELSQSRNEGDASDDPDVDWG
jgi:hypothetical protein